MARAFVVSVVVAVLGAFTAFPALADTTHPFLGNITLASGDNPQPSAVDDDGNLIVWLNDQKAVGKFDINGNPVNFTELGTHLIDGAGGGDCPNTPSDCDLVPTNGFGTDSEVSGASVAIDHSGGPADGYIYVQNNHGNEGEINVFDSTGAYRGSIDQAQAFPQGARPHRESDGISVASNGMLYVVKNPFGNNPGRIDRYLPEDGDPANTVFINQIRERCTAFCLATFNDYQSVAAGIDYVYVGGYDQHITNGTILDGTQWFYMKFPVEEFRRPGQRDWARPIDFSPDLGPFGDSGWLGVNNLGLGSDAYLKVSGVDPANEHTFIGLGGVGFEEWTPDNERVGPLFGGDKLAGFQDVHTVAFDRSGGPTDGRIYARGKETSQIAVFGPPVVIPDVEDVEADPDHEAISLLATIDPAGGPEVSSCKVEYGLSQSYDKDEPCDVPTPYSGETEVSVEIPGLGVGDTIHYRFVVSNANGTNTTDDATAKTEAVLDVETKAATDLASTSALLNGSLDPDGVATDYYFEWGISTDYTQETPQETIPAASGETPVNPTPIENLQPGRTYHYRLVATNSLGTSYGPNRSFAAPASPRIASVWSNDVASTSAVLNATISPFGYETAYYFEYGLTPSYGNTLPEVSIGSVNETQSVSRQISSLQPGVTYHYRVVATNEWGTSRSRNATFSFNPPSCPNAHVRQRIGANYLPDCRAYELVSPGNAGGIVLFPGEVIRNYGNDGLNFLASGFRLKVQNSGGLATSPSRFGFHGGLGGIPGLHSPNAILDRYVATRTNHGWVTTYPGQKGDETFLAASPFCSDSLTTCIDYRVDPEEFAIRSRAPSVWDVSGKSLGRWPTNLEEVAGGEEYVGDHVPSPDFSHFVFSSRDHAFASGGVAGSPGSVYDNEIAAETVEIASLLPNGDPIPRDAGPSDEFIRVAAVSRDGSHILMSTVAPGEERHLYMRVDGAVSYDLGKGAGARFAEMSEDGSTVAFTSAAQITSDDTDSSVDMFVWSEETNEVIRVSQGNGRGDTDVCNASWIGACDVAPIEPERPELDDVISADSGDVYFYSPEQLDPENPGVINERNLYGLHEGKAKFVATFDPGTEVERMQISSSGSHAAFLTTAQLTPYENTSPNSSGVDTAWREMYLFEAATGEVTCVSCIPTGEPPTVEWEEVGLVSSIAGKMLKDVMASQSGRFMSDDGRIAFATADALVPQDSNEKIDVYEYVDNRPQLITSGVGDRDHQIGNDFTPVTTIGLEGISRDGIDLYFSTFETYVPQDVNGSFLKFYDARTNGGFLAVPPPLPCTAADECHGDTSAAQAEPRIGTSGALGASGNVVSQAQKRKGAKRAAKARKRARQRKRARHSRAQRRRGGQR
jgi:hypothetical protein